ncbi:MAG: polysaccharide deacetylase family protein [Myxococcales bacterium]|nr:polysaccharide deacetylase family protein [Myxococcales bacterium]
MNLHGTPSRDATAFRQQVEWVARRFEFVSPQQFFAIARGEFAPPLRPSVMFTFDDGLRSNAEIAAPILESFGIRGLFFVCPGFSELEGAAAKAFFYSRVEPQTTPSHDPEDWTPLRPADVTALHRDGHTIGSHTWSHARLSEVSPAEFPLQIDRSAKAIEGWTGARCDAFAWTFAWDAITPAARDAALRRHAFVFGACPGTTRAAQIDPRLVFRTHVEAHWSVDEYAFFYSGLADPLWLPRRRSLRHLLGA